MDSTVSLYHAAKNYSIACAVSFDYGSLHNHQEIPFAAWHCKRLGIQHEIISLLFISELFKSGLLSGDIPHGHYTAPKMKRTVVPFRNGVMLAVACGLAESLKADGVMIAAHAGDHTIYPDCRERFMRSMAAAMHLGTYDNIKLIRPFIHLSKAQIAARGHKLGVDFSQTWSCYKGGKVHCGLCGTCVERREAFKLARVPDPTVYGNAKRRP